MCLGTIESSSLSRFRFSATRCCSCSWSKTDKKLLEFFFLKKWKPKYLLGLDTVLVGVLVDIELVVVDVVAAEDLEEFAGDFQWFARLACAEVNYEIGCQPWSSTNAVETKWLLLMVVAAVDGYSFELSSDCWPSPLHYFVGYAVRLWSFGHFAYFE